MNSTSPDNGQPEFSLSSLPSEKTGLSERELEILRLLATGVSNKEIAQKLFISPNTVKVHLRNIFAKTGVVSRTEATLFAIRTGLVLVDTPLTPPPFAPEAEISSVTDGAALLAMTPTIAPVRHPFVMGWAITAMVVIALIASPFLWRALTAVTTTPTAQANTPSPNPIPPRWQASADLPMARRGFAVATHNNQIFVIAGETSEAITAEVDRYDPATDQWESLSPKPIAVAEASAAVVGGQVYVPGGRLATGAVTDTVEAYDPTTNTWEQRASLPVALSAYALAVFEGRLYLFGGWDGTAYSADVFVYDPGQNVWTTLAAMSTARGRAGVAVASGQIYLMGGTDGRQTLTQNESFDPNSATWTERAPLPAARVSLGATTIADNVYLVGGEGQVGPSLTLQYSPTRDEWQAFEAPPDITQWVQPGLAVLNGQSLYVFGGERDGLLTAESLNYQVLYYIVIPIIK